MSLVLSDGVRTYSYDLENRLKTIGGPSSLTLHYDPLGRLRQTVASNFTIDYVYDGQSMIMENDVVAGTLKSRYVFGEGIDEPIVWYEGSTRSWLMADERGSIVNDTSDTQAIGTIYKYDAFGVADHLTGTRFRYGAKARLPFQMLWYSRARIYAPELGRFLQTDPIGFAGGDRNLYSYVGNDPVNMEDPTGLYGCVSGIAEPWIITVTTSSGSASGLAWANTGTYCGGSVGGGAFYGMPNGGQNQYTTNYSNWNFNSASRTDGQVGACHKAELELSFGVQMSGVFRSEAFSFGYDIDFVSIRARATWDQWTSLTRPVLDVRTRQNFTIIGGIGPLASEVGRRRESAPRQPLSRVPFKNVSELSSGWGGQIAGVYGLKGFVGGSGGPDGGCRMAGEPVR